MHTLIILTTVLSSLSLEPTPASLKAPVPRAVSLPSPLRGTSSTTLPALQNPGLHLMDPLGNEQGNGEAANRLFLEFLAGSGIGILGAGLAGLALGSNIESPASLAIPSSVLLLGSGVGVALVGAVMDGRGKFGYALLGSLVGSVAVLLVGVGMLQFGGCAGNFSASCSSMQPIAFSLLGLLVVPSAGAMVAYELSLPKSWLLLSRAPGELPAPRGVVPVFALATQGLGATVGLAGTL
jgi:hypothetical protein